MRAPPLRQIRDQLLGLVADADELLREADGDLAVDRIIDGFSGTLFPTLTQSPIAEQFTMDVKIKSFETSLTEAVDSHSPTTAEQSLNRHQSEFQVHRRSTENS